MAVNKRDDRPLNERETTDYLFARAKDAVVAADASVLNKIKGLEALAAAATKLAVSLREGNHDAVIAKAARTAEAAMATAHDAFVDFIDAVKKPQVLASHPVDTREMDRFLTETSTMHTRLEAWALLYEGRVQDVVAQIGALEAQVPETVPPIMTPPEPDGDLPF